MQPKDSKNIKSTHSQGFSINSKNKKIDDKMLINKLLTKTKSSKIPNDSNTQNKKYHDIEIQKIYNTWPSNNGFYAEFTKPEPLKIGTKVDRYGSNSGSFFAPYNTPFSMRALPNTTNLNNYHVFEVIKEFTPKSGVIASWFGQPGGGIQYLFIDNGNVKKIESMLGEYIREIKIK